MKTGQGGETVPLLLDVENYCLRVLNLIMA